MFKTTSSPIEDWLNPDDDWEVNYDSSDADITRKILRTTVISEWPKTTESKSSEKWGIFRILKFLDLKQGPFCTSKTQVHVLIYLKVLFIETEFDANYTSYRY